MPMTLAESDRSVGDPATTDGLLLVASVFPHQAVIVNFQFPGDKHCLWIAISGWLQDLELLDDLRHKVGKLNFKVCLQNWSEVQTG